MAAPFRVTASSPLGAASAGAAESVHLLGMALHSSLNPQIVAARLCSTLTGLLRADRCAVVEGSDPADPQAPLVQEAFSRKEAVLAEGPSSALCAPLFSDRHPVGAILVERGAPFSAEELKLLATVAPAAAAAIHHARLFDRATLDDLTGLPNRQRFTAELEDAVAAGGAVSLTLFDVDRLKDKNDVYGRAVGDRALAELGLMIRGRLVAATCGSRTGDDEFAVLFGGLDAAHARDLAEDFRRAVNDRIFDESHDGIHLTVSAGVAELKRGEMASALFARAADALAAAKRGGRDRVEVAR